jgi:hypothetical protein
MEVAVQEVEVAVQEMEVAVQEMEVAVQEMEVAVQEAWKVCVPVRRSAVGCNLSPSCRSDRAPAALARRSSQGGHSPRGPEAWGPWLKSWYFGEWHDRILASSTIQFGLLQAHTRC